jgi:hypothetical protein
VGVGRGAGGSDQGIGANAIGYDAARYNQGQGAVAIGFNTGYSTQGISAIAVGSAAGCNNQGANTIAMGNAAGFEFQSSFSIALGLSTAQTYQKEYAVAIGPWAGWSTQGAYSIALGYGAGSNSQPAQSIVINADSNALSPTTGSALYIAPIRTQTSNNTGALVYDTTSKEVTYNSSKTFVIDHPTDVSRYLVHACLEGPEAGVYYRGTAEINEGSSAVSVALPPYATALATDWTIQLTAVGSPRVLGVSEVSEEGMFVIQGPPGKVHWHATGRRATVVVEPRKDEVVLKGDGPYRWAESALL